MIKLENEEAVTKQISDTDLACIHIGAEWAPECAEIDSILEILKLEYKDITFANVDAEKFEFFCVKNQVNSVPTLIFYKFGDVYSRVEGFNVPEIKQQCQKLSNFAGLRPPQNLSSGHDGINGDNGDESAKLSEQIFNDHLKSLINKAEVMIFIKGSPSEPKCGFSKQLIEILAQYKDCKYSYYDILQNDKVRQGLKTFSDWQTYPQVYVKGQLIGGIDIVRELHESGELKDTLPKVESVSVEDRIKKLLGDNPIILFMKGNPREPKCKFSRALMDIFKTLPSNIKYETFDILQDEDIRQGLKEYSDWPTYPQLYVKGELIGGLDIIKELHENGELVQSMTVS